MAGLGSLSFSEFYHIVISAFDFHQTASGRKYSHSRELLNLLLGSQKAAEARAILPKQRTSYS